jgi:hypothetical protein
MSFSSSALNCLNIKRSRQSFGSFATRGQRALMEVAFWGFGHEFEAKSFERPPDDVSLLS